MQARPDSNPKNKGLVQHLKRDPETAAIEIEAQIHQNDEHRWSAPCQLQAVEIQQWETTAPAVGGLTDRVFMHTEITSPKCSGAISRLGAEA
jgi:hypothetical protein